MRRTHLLYFFQFEKFDIMEVVAFAVCHVQFGINLALASDSVVDGIVENSAFFGQCKTKHLLVFPAKKSLQRAARANKTRQ